VISVHNQQKSIDQPQFLACGSIYAQCAICYRQSICLSVHLLHGWIGQKKAEVRIMQLSPQSSPMTLVSSWLTSQQNSKGNIGNRGAEWDRGRKNMQFSANKSPYLRNGAR